MWLQVIALSATLLPVYGSPDVSAETAAEVDLSPQFNSTRTCTVGWGHELACQANAFSVTAQDLLAYFQCVSPDSLVRVQLWTPYSSPATFELRRDATLHSFQQMLHVAGHLEEHSLSVAYDSLSTFIDVLSIPGGPATWWIIRDGLGRELLRPVTLWTEPGARYVLTLNSHGQAQALSCAPDVARLNRLPQGARATVTLPFTRVAGQMTAQGLVMFELALGTVVSAGRPLCLAMLLSALGLHILSAGMYNAQGSQQGQELAVSSWGSAVAAVPTIMRIWTYSCNAPVEVPFDSAPNTLLMQQQVARVGRGMPPAGDFAWTLPRIIQGRAHLIHFPPRAAPPYVFWLLHYRARGHVIAASDQAFDWAFVGALATEAFGEPWFQQGAFGIVQQGRVVGYNEAIGIPPHGAIIHLVRTSLQPRLGYTGWEAPADPGCILPFDYDICLGARGERAIEAARADAPARHSEAPAQTTQPQRTSEQDPARVGRQLAHQITEVSNDLQVLISRLETAGVLPAPDVAPWTTETPAADSAPAQDSSSPAKTSPLHFILVAVYIRHVGGCAPSMLGTGALFLLSQVWQPYQVLARDDDLEHDPDSVSLASGPSEPSSPDLLEEVSAPTPLTQLAEVPGESPVILPSSDPAASTRLPEQESLASAAMPAAALTVCAIQYRFSCAIRGLYLATEPGSAYIPAGYSVIMHNPFTGRPQCRLRTTPQGSAQVLRNTLADYAQRRGWQQVLDVQPQPDPDAVHLIPSAARQDLAAVVLQENGQLHPRCISRLFPAQGSGTARINGRDGRVVTPYPCRRVQQGQIHIRDGNCLPVNFGPYGPPPPQPAHSSTVRHSLWGLACASLLLHRGSGMLLTLLLLTGSEAMGPTTDFRDTKPIYRISAFPWRQRPQARTACDFCDRRACRFTILCPWTGPHGVYTADSTAPLDDTWQHYRSGLPGWPDQQYTPTWPGLRHDRLTVIPVPPRNDIVCVVARRSFSARAILLPDRIQLGDATAAISQVTPWRPQAVLLPPAVYLATLRAPSAPLALRTGDVLEVLEDGDREDTYAHNNQDLLRGYAVWSRGVGVLCTMLIRLWSVEWPRPIITWLSPGAEWSPRALTFTGEFQRSYPGRWIPIAWGPSKILQFISPSALPSSVHVLVECPDRTFATSIDPYISQEALALALQTPAEEIRVVGADFGREDLPPCLRDGDILCTRHTGETSPPLYGWPDDDTGPPDIALPTGIALALGGRHPLMALTVVSLHFLPVAAVRTSQPDRSRSSSPTSDRPTRTSPRPSRWRPDQDLPFREVATRWFDYSVLCPFQGWSQGARGTPDITGDTVQTVMLHWCQQWPPQYVLLNGVDPSGPVIVIPGGLARLATVLVFTPGSLSAHLVPRVTSYRRVHTYIRRISSSNIRIRFPPALRVSEQGPDADIVLRDGDAFETYNDASHSSFRPGQLIPTIPISSLPHHFAWHMPFRVEQGGWVHVWAANVQGGRVSARCWVHRGSFWTPQWCNFQLPNSLPGPERWVPAIGANDTVCHFVRRSDLGQAHVLLHNPRSDPAFRCVLCPATSGEASYPSGWRLRADLAARSPILHLRDGDVMVPGGSPTRRRVQYRALPSLAIAALGYGRKSLAVLAILLSGHMSAASGMQTAPVNTDTAMCRVGKYDWRIPSSQRLCSSVAHDEATACFLSPFVGGSEAIPVSADTSCAALSDDLLGPEPVWASHIVPVWPALSLHTIIFVGAPSHPSLAVVTVVSPDWQAAFLIPRRADVAWVLKYVRSHTRYPILRLHPPLSASATGVSEQEAVNWRTGDVLFAQPCEDPPQNLQQPSFSSGLQVRHRAFWAMDFDATCPLTVVLWRPARRPTRTTMPPGARWSAARSTFLGEFELRYPGRWVPVPWAYDDDPHLCQRSGNPDTINIIYERVEANKLQGDCLAVNDWSTVASVARFLDLSAEHLHLLDMTILTYQAP